MHEGQRDQHSSRRDAPLAAQLLYPSKRSSTAFNTVSVVDIYIIRIHWSVRPTGEMRGKRQPALVLALVVLVVSSLCVTKRREGRPADTSRN